MKKKILLLFVLVMGFCFIPNVFATSISSCDSVISSSVMIDPKVPEIVSTIVNAIKIAVPILLVIFGSIDLVKGITAQKDDEIKKGQQIFIKRLIAGALVFFVFMVVQLVISLAAGNSGKANSQNIMTCVNCFINNNCTTR